MSRVRHSVGGRIRGRYVVAVGASLALTSTMALWTMEEPQSEAENMAAAFVDALNKRDIAAAAAMTTYPNAAAASLTQMFDGLAADGASTSEFELGQFVDLSDESGFFTLDSDWNFGEGKDWQYSTRGSAKKLSVGWRISWEPDVLAPDLLPDNSVSYVRTDAAPPLVFDAAQNVLMNERTINAILLDPAQTPDPAASAAQLADVIDVVAPLITADSMLSELAASAGNSILAVNLRDDDFAVLEDDLRAIPGVVVTQTPKLIAGDRRITSPLLDSLRSAWQQNRDATAGWAVDVVNGDGSLTRQAGFQGPGGPDLHATLDPRIQLAAEEAVVSVGTAASIVAIAPSTGAIVAVAQNSYANEQGQIAFSAMYPAGSLSDLLAAGGVDASGVGLGVNYAMPGLDAHTGSVPSGNSAVERIRTVGNETSELSVTPFGLAQLGATIARGAAPVPSIVVGQPAAPDTDPGTVAPAALANLRTLLQNSSHDRGLGGYAGLAGFAGASVDDRWFIGSRDDLAFAVYIEDAGDDDQAVRMSTKLLDEIASGSTE
ncbi:MULTISPECIES: NTF2-like N-terminal transpeptidase domain-containing protein [Nocardiaceae]|uniref:NTF2-like N-terminal transpeptidase domain-containing protein n=1 Tax=Nocardiaceae TaxID=85025 RepID=UPI001E57F945|nr:MULTISPECIES: NTF2-like N-terminal transpeptidase domain-containing protein [Rhodococcus]MCC8927883.1 penicillin-binding protein [Rhodococcus sp. I2R]MCZ4276209.1 penicillin-binding protein [Rhodococcus yunnanensis]